VNRALADAVARAEAYSPYLRGLIRRFPEVLIIPPPLGEVARSDGGAVSAASGGATLPALTPLHRSAVPLPQRGRTFIDPSLPVPTALRQAKGRLALSVALGDLAGLLTLDDVTHQLSDFADMALDHALRAAFASIVPGEEVRGFAIIALGKHGSRELNYSSDIDPILIFDPATLPVRGRDEPVETAVRIAKKLCEIMQARDEDGYVFRVDLRLRPNAEITPIALPIGAAIAYYESSALAWERAAFIRARACAGDATLGQYFLDTLRPFVWRRGLDFGAVAEIRGMSRRIRDHHAQGQIFGPGYDLKRGRGGIRECEFFAQIHQMIHGGRDPALRTGATLPALSALTKAGWIAAEDAATLGKSYQLYRTIEHRLQMVDDLQTHSLPKGADALDNVARLHGVENGAAIIALLAPHVEAVGTIYDALDGEKSEALPHDPNQLVVSLIDAGFGDGADIARRISGWRSGTMRALRSPPALEALEAVLPSLVRQLGAAPVPLTAFNRLDAMIERLPSAVNLFRLLAARPQLLRLLTDILCHAPTLADDLSRRADLIDGLIDASALQPVGSVADIVARLTHPDSNADLEARLDRVRHIVGETRFALGAQIIAVTSDPLDVAAGYARLAEAAVETLASATIAAFEAAHGKVSGSEFVILALGRLGGAALTHASDLDLIYLFTGDFRGESDGPKPLGTVHYFNRLAQRVTAGLSVATASGALYEIDTRLRPSGSKGPLVVSLEGFAHYQRAEAWTWEHMALCRARVVYGSANARAEAQSVIDDILTAPRDGATLIKDALKMRADMATHKPPKTALDVKLGAGGLVDLEFAIHVTQLREGRGFDPLLPGAITALDMGAPLFEAHALLTRFLVTMRLVAPDLEPPPEATCALVARACGMDDWEALLAQLAMARQEIADAWHCATA
jgi:[glutamine synthetase] adenylyltransferase / [glutamine synthetase]-adenylyl-L-tyrosine phosphorylase